LIHSARLRHNFLPDLAAIVFAPVGQDVVSVLVLEVQQHEMKNRVDVGAVVCTCSKRFTTENARVSTAWLLFSLTSTYPVDVLIVGSVAMAGKGYRSQV